MGVIVYRLVFKSAAGGSLQRSELSTETPLQFLNKIGNREWGIPIYFPVWLRNRWITTGSQPY